MRRHVCPWWAGFFIDNRLRRRLHHPERILSPHVRPGMTVMDVGCGMGLFAIALARLVGDQGRVIAIDLQQKMLDVLLKRAQQAKVAERIHAQRCAADSIACDATVDFALAFYSAHEIPDQRRLLREIGACLRPQGRLLVVEPLLHVPAKKFAALVAVAEEIGFEVEARPRIRLSRAVVLRKARATR
jgi:ubiquinone/menaquinone biosynthesis C-methylase UbiE